MADLVLERFQRLRCLDGRGHNLLVSLADNSVASGRKPPSYRVSSV
jgi:hypothetical protein